MPLTSPLRSTMDYRTRLKIATLLDGLKRELTDQSKSPAETWKNHQVKLTDAVIRLMEILSENDPGK